jgi:hypothetical protein
LRTAARSTAPGVPLEAIRIGSQLDRNRPPVPGLVLTHATHPDSRRPGVVAALTEDADPMWVRRVVELAITLPETMSQDELNDLIAARPTEDAEP